MEAPGGDSLQVTLEAGLPLSGRVLDRTTREPIAGATVLAWNAEATVFGSEATAAKHAWTRLVDVHITAGPPPSADHPVAENLLFLGPGGRLAGRVVGADGKPIAHADVSLRPESGRVLDPLRDPLPVAESAEDGKFAIEGIPAGTRLRAGVWEDGYPGADVGPYDLSAGSDRSDIEVNLVQGATDVSVQERGETIAAITLP